MKKRNAFVSTALVLLLMMLSACSTEDNTGSAKSNGTTTSIGEEKILKIGSVNNDHHTLFKGYQKFQEIVEKETDGRIKVDIYPNGQLGDDRTMIEGLQFGTLEATGVSTSMLANWAPPMLVYDLPFAFPDTETAYKVLDGPFGEKVGKLLEKENLILLSYMENGFRHLTNNKKEIRTIEDLKGMKIRTMQTPIHLETWKQMGASPTPMAYTELFTALQQGVIDGQENPYGNMAMDKFYEVQKYLTETNHVYNPMGLVVSKSFFEALSEEDQNILKKAGVEAALYQRKLNQEETEGYKQILVENGVQITELSSEELGEFTKATEEVYEKYAVEIGKEYIDEFLGELDK
ncbi:TRAP dicarboxylate transporter, dctp subunit [Bacillus sp. OxB-1]|uniref:TRAP transporter substrate-binding protein n=1 Tax=Bacillus sp. (strain OxB-1) TaxID=98228 RepID=UPI000581F59D|nr:TRAP transporter substrate-binding protein [Bacillus sp. OxB-1]BAQ11628.1 TRAP dicarboxylate transporter, dctp subunit [Bacillus sp. OxB-1]